MLTFRSFNKSFVHGALVCSAYALGPYSMVTLVLAGLICVYAGWFRQASLVSFLSGVIVAVVSYTFMEFLREPEMGYVFFWVPLALLIILPTVLTGYVIGKFIFTITHQRGNDAKSDA